MKNAASLFCIAYAILLFQACSKNEVKVTSKQSKTSFSKGKVTLSASNLATANYVMQNFSTGGAISVFGNLTSPQAVMHEWQYKATTGQQFNISAVGTYYKIINVNSGLAVEVPQGAIAGTQLDQNTYTGTDNQLWNIQYYSYGIYYMLNKATGYGVTLDTLSAANGVKITQRPLAYSYGFGWFLYSLDKFFYNPLLTSGADPWVIQQGGYYYYMETTGGNLMIWKTAKMSDLHSAVAVTVWTPPTGTAYSKDIWAPELHYLDSKWYIYFAADDGTDANHRIYVLENTAADPTTGTWTFKGKIADTTNIWAIDPTILQSGDNRYLIWSGWKTQNTSQSGIQQLYIAKMSNAWTITGPRVMISQPTYSWEKNGLVNEGPEILNNSAGNIFCIYSGSGCWTDDYKLGQLTLAPAADPMVAASWTKNPNPVFQKSIAHSVYAPGHCSFFKSLDGTQDWILYHANPASGQGCGGYRTPRIQQFTWNSDGSPNFGIPLATTFGIKKPAGE